MYSSEGLAIYKQIDYKIDFRGRYLSHFPTVSSLYFSVLELIQISVSDNYVS